MKKRNMTLPKRVLAMSLSFAMCAGMVCTTAFANEADEAANNVYVYVGVDVVETEKAEEFTGKFGGNEADKAALDAEKAGLDETAKSIDDITDDLKKNDPKFEGDKGAIETAQGAVNGALDKLQAADKPTYPAETETDKSDAPAEAKDPSFADKVNGAVDELNDAQKATDDAAKADADKADKDSDALETEKTEKDKYFNGEAKTKLEEAKNTATKAVDDAKDAVKACQDEKARLDEDLNTQIANLGERPSDTAPVRQEGQSDAEYAAVHNAWVQACEDYNAKLAPIQAQYEQDSADLKLQSDAAVQAVAEAEAALKTANEELNAYNASAQKEYDILNGKADEIQGIHDKLDEYNTAVKESDELKDGYDHLAGEYNAAAKDYNEAVKDYNDAVKDYNDKDVKEYNDKVDDLNETVGEYNTAAGEYNAKADEYNEKVDSYNSEATTWNDSKANVDLLADELGKLSTDGITVKAEDVQKALDTTGWDKLSDEEYNTRVQEYNKAVEQYNKAVESFNAALSSNKQEVIDKVVSTYFQSDAQSWTTPETTGDTHWYTLGKIDVSDAFVKEYSFGSVSSQFEGNAYEWKKNSDGSVTPKELDPKVTETIKGNEWLGEDLFQKFAGELDAASANDGTFQADSKVNKDSEYQKLMTDGINKWVLTSANGANSGTKGTSYIKEGTTTWHLNGYLKVTQMSKLATLEERAVRIDDTKKDTFNSKAQEEETIDGTELKEVNLYNPHEPKKPVPEKVTAPQDNWTLEGVEFEGTELETVVPDPLNVADRITPPTPGEGGGPDGGGGTGGGGGGDTPPVIINDPDVPLAETPEEPVEEPVVEIPDEEVPLAETPEEVVIPDEDVPLAAVPQTGDISTAWYAAALTSACALAAVSLRKKEDED